MPQPVTGSPTQGFGPASVAPRNLAAAVERLAHAIRVLRWDAAYALGLSPTQLSVLEMLDVAPAPRRRVGTLAGELDLTAPTVSDAVATLRRKGLVESAGPNVRGPLGLTEAGRDLLRSIPRWDAPLEGALESLAAERRDTTYAAMLDVIGALQRAGVITVARTCTTCRFFDRSGDTPRCALLDAPLPPAALRLDCPEHEQVA